jgi:hypothetical protein
MIIDQQKRDERRLWKIKCRKICDVTVSRQYWCLRKFYLKNGFHSRIQNIHDTIIFSKWERKRCPDLPFRTFIIGISVKSLIIYVGMIEVTTYVFRSFVFDSLPLSLFFVDRIVLNIEISRSSAGALEKDKHWLKSVLNKGLREIHFTCAICTEGARIRIKKIETCYFLDHKFIFLDLEQEYSSSCKVEHTV